MKGQEIFRKQTSEAELNLAVGDRFLASITAAHQQALALVEQVDRQLNLEKLAKL